MKGAGVRRGWLINVLPRSRQHAERVLRPNARRVLTPRATRKKGREWGRCIATANGLGNIPRNPLPAFSVRASPSHADASRWPQPMLGNTHFANLGYFLVAGDSRSAILLMQALAIRPP